MGGHGWAYVAANGSGQGMGTISKEMLGSTADLTCSILQGSKSVRELLEVLPK